MRGTHLSPVQRKERYMRMSPAQFLIPSPVCFAWSFAPQLFSGRSSRFRLRHRTGAASEWSALPASLTRSRVAPRDDPLRVLITLAIQQLHSTSTTYLARVPRTRRSRHSRRACGYVLSLRRCDHMQDADMFTSLPDARRRYHPAYIQCLQPCGPGHNLRLP